MMWDGSPCLLHRLPLLWFSPVASYLVTGKWCNTEWNPTSWITNSPPAPMAKDRCLQGGPSTDSMNQHCQLEGNSQKSRMHPKVP